MIAADLLYLEETFEDLVLTFRKLSSEKTKILISFRVRLPELVEKFLAVLKDGGFKWLEVEGNVLQKIHPNPKERFLIASLDPNTKEE